MRFARIIKPLGWFTILLVLSLFTGGCSTKVQKESFIDNGVSEKERTFEQEIVIVDLMNEGQKNFYYSDLPQPDLPSKFASTAMEANFRVWSK